MQTNVGKSINHSKWFPDMHMSRITVIQRPGAHYQVATLHRLFYPYHDKQTLIKYHVGEAPSKAFPNVPIQLSYQKIVIYALYSFVKDNDKKSPQIEQSNFFQKIESPVLGEVLK